MLCIRFFADSEALIPRTQGFNPSDQAELEYCCRSSMTGMQHKCTDTRKCLSSQRDAPVGLFPERSSLLFTMSRILFLPNGPFANCSILIIYQLLACLQLLSHPAAMLPFWHWYV